MPRAWRVEQAVQHVHTRLCSSRRPRVRGGDRSRVRRAWRLGSALSLLCTAWVFGPSQAAAAHAPARELATVTSARGGSDLFVIDADETIKHYWRAGHSGRWSGFELLDGLARDIAAIELGDGSFEVFVVGTDADVWSNKQLGRAHWSGFHPLGFRSKQVAVAKTPSGRFELFVIGENDGVFRSVRNGPDGEWSEWQGLGGVASQLTAAQADDGSVHVFIVGSDGAIWTTRSDRVAWQSLGGSVSDVAAGRGSDGRLMLYAVGDGGTVWQRQAERAGADFGAWQRLRGTAKRVSASSSGGSQGVFALGSQVSEFQLDQQRWRSLDSELPFESTFYGVATMEIPSLHVKQRRRMQIGVRFSPDRRDVEIVSFPSFTTKEFGTPFGKNRTTVSLKAGGRGSYDPRTGRLVLPVTLHFDQSLDVPFVEEDADVALTLTTDGDRGSHVAVVDDLAKLGLAASSRFTARGGISPLNHKRCEVTIVGGFRAPQRIWQ